MNQGSLGGSVLGFPKCQLHFVVFYWAAIFRDETAVHVLKEAQKFFILENSFKLSAHLLGQQRLHRHMHVS